jgi:hypothetical protein
VKELTGSWYETPGRKSAFDIQNDTFALRTRTPMTKSFEGSYGRPTHHSDGLADLLNNSFGNAAEKHITTNYRDRVFVAKTRKLKYYGGL